MIISIVDCNHGSFTYEQEEVANLSRDICLRTPDQPLDKNTDIVIVQRTQVDGAFVDALPRCKVVVRYGVGLDNIDLDAMRDRSISVVNFPDFCTDEVATHAVGLILYLHRRFDQVHMYREDLPIHWGRSTLLKGAQSNSMTTIGIVGLGRIGSRVGHFLRNMGFDVMSYDPYVGIGHLMNRAMSLDELIRRSDIVSIHAPLTDETKGMIDSEMIRKMKPGGCLVNTARGEIVDMQDLAHELRYGHIRAACIDVSDPEPVDKMLLKIPNLFITPHCAFYSAQSLERLKRGVIVESVRAYDMQSSTN